MSLFTPLFRPAALLRATLLRTVLLLSGLVLAGYLSLSCGGSREQTQAGGDETAPQVASPLSAEDESETKPIGRLLPPPASNGALAPHLQTTDRGVLLSWLEPLGDDPPTHQLRMAWLRDGVWSTATTVHSGEGIFANWADVPAVVTHPDGSLIAHWLQKTSPETYSYAIELARSVDDGVSWTAFGRLNDDTVDAEHGFVSYAAEGAALRAFWLDGREMPDGAPMSVRTALITDSVGSSELLDARVCECCPTAAAPSPNGALVAYRGRSLEEVRNTFVVRRVDGAWLAAEEVADDRWQIPGCPVNGPAMASAGEQVALTWFTAPEADTQVKIAFSSNAGESFTPPFVMARGPLLGRVDIALLDGGDAVVSWLAMADDRAALQLQRVAPDGSMGEPLTVAETDASRVSGYPELERAGDQLVVAWVEVDGEEPAQLSLLELAIHAVPAPI